MLNLFRYIGLRHLQLKPMRSFLTMLGVAFGIALYVAIAIINHSTQNSMRESIEAIAGKAKITITSGGPVGFPEEQLEKIRLVNGVKYAIPMIESRAFFAGAKESAEGLYILGVDLLQEQGVRTYKTTDQKIIDDPLIFLNQPDSIILTKRIADQKGLKIDSKIKLATTDGVKIFTVRGLLEPEGAARAYGGSLAIMDIDGARVSFGKEGKTDRIDIVPTDEFEGKKIEVLKTNLREALGPSFKIETPEAQSAQMEALLGSYQLILTFFSTIALLVGLFLIVNSISVSVAERRKEIGTLRALGATKRSMVVLFVSEVIGVGFFGSILGCLMGRGLAEILVKQVTNSIAGQFQTQINVAHLDFTVNQMMMAVGLGTVASIFAALWPSMAAAKVHPLESMKVHAESRSEKDDRKARNLVILGFLILVFVTLQARFTLSSIWFGFDILGKAGSVFGTAIFGPFLVLLALKGLKAISKNYSPTMFRLSQENLLKSPKRTSSNVMALLVGLFLVMLIATIRSSFAITLTNWLDQIFVADMMVSSSGRVITSDVQPLKHEIQEELMQVPGVRPVGPNRGTGYRLIRTDYHGKKITIKALDRFADFYHMKNYAITSGDTETEAAKIFEIKEPTVLASDSFLLKQHQKIGNMIDLDTPTGRVQFKIVGSLTDFATPEGVLYMNREHYKKYWKDDLVTVFAINVAEGYTLEQVRAEIDRRIGQKHNVVVVSNAEFKQQMQETIQRTFAYTKAIEWIALIVGLLGLLNTMLISVMERTREIGMMRAVGATQSQISRMIYGEAFLQGFFGSCVAVLLGGYLGWVFVTYSLTTNLGWMVEFHFAYSAVFTTIITGVIVAMIAGIYPSRRASALPITEALEYE